MIGSRSLIKMRLNGLFRARAIVFLLTCLTTFSSFGQGNSKKPVDLSDTTYSFPDGKLIIPALLAGYGFAQYTLDPVLDLNMTVKNRITSQITRPFRIDDYSRFVPAVAAYGLNLVGINGKHDFIDRSIILGTSMILVHATVYGIKYTARIQRPDGTTFNALPSGHTAVAFAGAEFLMQEFKNESVWYGIAGYAVAAGTGFLRIYNNRHWLTDVVAGAGFGILSTKMAYWVFPRLKGFLFKDWKVSLSVSPAFGFQPGQPAGNSLPGKFGKD
jgi:membrane-associated phospholipid phosphatase